MNRCISMIATIGVMSAVAAAGVPGQINHQGVVRVDGVPFNGAGLFKFAIVDPDAPSNLWSNDGSVTGGVGGVPTAAVSLTVTNGVYSVALGDTSVANMTDVIAPSIFTDDNAVLRIWFDDGVNGEQQLSPDHKLTTAPYTDRTEIADRLNAPGTSIGAVTVDSTGHVGIGTVPVPTAILKVGNDSFTSSIQVDSNTGSGGVPLVLIRSSVHADSDLLFMITGDSDADAGGPWSAFVVGAGGTVSGRFGLYHGPSDARLKRDVVTVPDALQRVLALRGVNFKWKDSHLDGDNLQMGLIAQEVEKVFPEVVHTANDKMGTKAVEYEHLVGALVEAMKELNSIVKQKDVELATQIKRIASFEARLSALEARSTVVTLADGGE